jgi:hypothetical protein
MLRLHGLRTMWAFHFQTRQITHDLLELGHEQTTLDVHDVLLGIRVTHHFVCEGFSRGVRGMELRSAGSLWRQRGLRVLCVITHFQLVDSVQKRRDQIPDFRIRAIDALEV